MFVRNARFSYQPQSMLIDTMWW